MVSRRRDLFSPAEGACGGRISIAALSLGMPKVHFEHRFAYSQRASPKIHKPISSFQGISFKLADMANAGGSFKIIDLQTCD